MIKEFKQGDEGIDYMHLKDGQYGPGEFNEDKLKREIKKELNELKLREPELAEHYEKYIFSKNTEVDKELAIDIPLDEIKFYPGSEKGPNPEDDPDTYGKWFIENQHEAFKGKHGEILDAEALGIKPKLLKTRDDSFRTEKAKQQLITRTATDYFFEQDELYPMQNYEG